MLNADGKELIKRKKLKTFEGTDNRAKSLKRRGEVDSEQRSRAGFKFEQEKGIPLPCLIGGKKRMVGIRGFTTGS